MASSTAQNLAALFAGKLKPTVLSDREIINFFLHTGAASYLKYDKRKKVFGFGGRHGGNAICRYLTQSNKERA